MGLGRIKVDALLCRLPQRCHLGHRGKCRAITRKLLRQAREQGQHQRIGLLPVEGPHQRHAGPAGQQAALQAMHVGHADRRQRRLSELLPIGVAAINGSVESAGGQCGRAGAGFAQGGLQALALALPNCLGKGGLPELPRRELRGPRQQVGVTQAAQQKAQSISACAGTKRGT